ncbi:MerR family transcriptional regulator [Lactobacillus rossiae]|uniref:MerR family transcriptional regulator n=3 Tax=Furfurilactobacillus TaxID=2767882 RepID=A0A7C9ITJ2_9LACO|nr:MerR family transcriptional regulator [Furfurilactobacillus milii]
MLVLMNRKGKQMNIAQFARLAGCTVETLRYYDRAELFQPLRRGNGYRDYAQTDLDVVKMIINLRKADVDVKTIKQIMVLFKTPVTTACYDDTLSFIAGQKQSFKEKAELFTRLAKITNTLQSQVMNGEPLTTLQTTLKKAGEGNA